MKLDWSGNKHFRQFIHLLAECDRGAASLLSTKNSRRRWRLQFPVKLSAAHERAECVNSFLCFLGGIKLTNIWDAVKIMTAAFASSGLWAREYATRRPLPCTTRWIKTIDARLCCLAGRRRSREKRRESASAGQMIHLGDVCLPSRAQLKRTENQEDLIHKLNKALLARNNLLICGCFGCCSDGGRNTNSN